MLFFLFVAVLYEEVHFVTLKGYEAEFDLA